MACKTCKSKRRRRSNISGMKKNQIGSTVKDGLLVAGGYAAANILNNKVSFVQSNPIIGVIAPIALGVLLKGKQGTGGCALASGMIAAGIVQGVKTFVPGIAESVGIAGYISRSNYTPGVAGGGSSFMVD